MLLPALSALPAGAQSVDQEVTCPDDSFYLVTIDEDIAFIQTFTAGESGQLTSVELQMDVQVTTPHLAPEEFLEVSIHPTTPMGVPTATVLASGATSLHSFAEIDRVWVPVDLTAADLRLVRNQRYGIRVASTSTPVPPFGEEFIWYTGCFGYPRGELFRDEGTFVQDMYQENGPFRTYMIPIALCGDGAVTGDETCDDGNTVSDDGCSATCQHELCGDGEPGPHEQCDDGNTIAGDGCNAVCQREFCGDDVTNDVTETCDDGNTLPDDGCGPTCLVEACGDGVVNGGEWCDDGNTASGDACAGDCTLEAAGAACRNTLLKAAQKYQTARLAAVARCQQQLASGKALSVADPAECASETAAAKKIASAGAQTRKTIAGGNKPKCTDALVAMLGACADTVDGIMAPDASSGCLAEAGAGSVEALTAELFPD